MKFCVPVFFIAAVSVVCAKHLGNGTSHTDCPKLCEKIWDPVCARFNGIQVNISNMCRLEELIKCASGLKRSIVFLHEGHCRKDGAMIEGDDAESEAELSENIDKEGDLVDKESDSEVESELMKYFDDDSIDSEEDDEEEYGEDEGGEDEDGEGEEEDEEGEEDDEEENDENITSFPAITTTGRLSKTPIKS